jgi:hypothetical protein
MDNELTREARKLREDVEKFNQEGNRIDAVVFVIVIVVLGAFVLRWLGVF